MAELVTVPSAEIAMNKINNALIVKEDPPEDTITEGLLCYENKK